MRCRSCTCFRCRCCTCSPRCLTRRGMNSWEHHRYEFLGTPSTFRRFLQDFWARLHPDLATQLHSRVLWRPASSSSPGVDLLRWPRSYAASSIVGCCWWPRLRFLRMPACQAFAHLQHARQSFCLSIAIFAVRSAFPAKGVSAFPPSADSQSRPSAEVLFACPRAEL